MWTANSAREQDFEEKLEQFLRRVLTSSARRRLSNLELVKPDFVKQIKLLLVELISNQKLSVPVTDEQLKTILKQFQKRREIKIRRL
ncbi:MAG TPA: hypothetical protein ENG66_05275 [Thermococcus sp.]|nr:hypothetical protein [Thermococcus sp.]